MPTATAPPSAPRHYALSALVARHAVTEARKAATQGPQAVAGVVWSHQVAQAVLSQRAVAEMLLEQEIQSAADALLNATAFTTDVQVLTGMLDTTSTTQEFERLVESLVQDAGRAAESVAVTVRHHISYVRFVNPPCCSRCAVLSGRVYSWSMGFLRHPNCDCSMIPTTVASAEPQDIGQLIADGQVSDLSKADRQAIADGADLGKVVNVRRRAAGLREAGRVLGRAGKPTPEGIYRMAATREEAVRLLTQHGYLIP